MKQDEEEEEEEEEEVIGKSAMGYIEHAKVYMRVYMRSKDN